MEINGIVIEDAVSRGIELLDTYAPENWRARIDWETYNHHSTESCILAQVYGRDFLAGYFRGYFRGVGMLEDAMYAADHPRSDGWNGGGIYARWYGFDGDTAMNNAFQDEWMRQLKAVAVPQREEC